MPEISREDMIEAAKRAAKESSIPLTCMEFIRRTGISKWQINRLFPEGRWTELRTLAGIDRHPMDRPTLSNDDLLAEFHRLVTQAGRIPTWAVFNAKAKMGSDSLMRRRFGSSAGPLRAYQAWLKANHPESPILERLSAKLQNGVVPRPESPDLDFVVPRWGGSSGPLFGPPINFRGLRHAPINEHGVVYIFGMVSYELGFIVEALQSSFPDCEAKRCMDKDRWQRVRIEFEFRSSDFHRHGHPVGGADLIVCWKHDWPDCPVEVLELRSAIDSLQG